MTVSRERDGALASGRRAAPAGSAGWLLVLHVAGIRHGGGKAVRAVPCDLQVGLHRGDGGRRGRTVLAYCGR